MSLFSSKGLEKPQAKADLSFIVAGQNNGWFILPQVIKKGDEEIENAIRVVQTKAGKPMFRLVLGKNKGEGEIAEYKCNIPIGNNGATALSNLTYMVSSFAPPAHRDKIVKKLGKKIDDNPVKYGTDPQAIADLLNGEIRRLIQLRRLDSVIDAVGCVLAYRNKDKNDRVWVNVPNHWGSNGYGNNGNPVFSFFTTDGEEGPVFEDLIFDEDLKAVSDGLEALQKEQREAYKASKKEEDAEATPEESDLPFEDEELPEVLDDQEDEW